MKTPSIDEALAFSDQELSEFLGHPTILKSFREELADLASLKGEARSEAERMWRERLTPSISADSLRWMKEDAERTTKSPKETLESTEVSSAF